MYYDIAGIETKRSQDFFDLRKTTSCLQHAEVEV